MSVPSKVWYHAMRMAVLSHSVVLAALAGIAAFLSGRADIVSVRALYEAVYERHAAASTFAVTAKVSVVNYERNQRQVELAVEDATGAVGLLFRLSDAIPEKPRAGDVIAATGRIVLGVGRKRYAVPDSLSVLRHGEAPEPQTASLPGLLGGVFDFRRVRIRAVLREAVQSAKNIHWMLLRIVDGTYTIVVPVLIDAAEAERLSGYVGREIVIDGFCSPADPGPLQNGRQIRVCDPKRIQLAADAACTPLPSSLDHLENIGPSVLANDGLHSVAGTVLAVWNGGRDALVRDARGRKVCVSFIRREDLSVGADVTVFGFPESNFVSIGLVNATPHAVVSKPPSVLLPPKPLRIFDLRRHEGIVCPRNDLHGALVRIHGRILSVPTRENGQALILGDGDEHVTVAAETILPTVAALAAGSEIEVTGYCIVEAVAWHAIKPQYTGIRIVPRLPSDVRVLARPSWWTPTRLLSVIGALCAALCGVFAWNVALRRASLRKGRELAREQLKHLRTETKMVERTRLAVELHDSLSQNLTGVSLEIAAAQQCGMRRADEMVRHVDTAARALGSCRLSLRDSLWDLRNRALEARTLGAAVRTTLQPHLHGIVLGIRFNVRRARFSDRFTHDILCIVRELALNGIRHGRATAVRIAGCLGNGQLLVSVSDNGCGFDPTACPGVAEGHFGIQGVRERLARRAGTLAYTRTHAGWTRARVSVRINDDSEEESRT